MIGANCKLIGQVTVIGHTSIGDGCVISPFAVLGGAPQDLSYKGEPTRLEIGSGCTIREGATMNVGTIKGGGHDARRQRRLLHEQQPCRP